MIKNSTKFTRFCNWSYLFSYTCFSEICCDAVKNDELLSVSIQSISLKNIFADIVDLAFIGQITFSHQNFENNWNKNVNFRKSIQSYPDKLKFIPANVS